MNMAKQSNGSWTDWIGADVVDNDGSSIGTLDNVYMDRSSGQPEWLLVKTGMMGSRRSFVPIAGAGADGDNLKIQYSKSLVKDAPSVDDDDGYLPPKDEERLYRHYGREDYREWDDTNDVDITAGQATTDRDSKDRGNDDAMTRSEEELRVATQDREVGRARLSKYVVTENVETTVPLRKERATIEREPITDANRDPALRGPEITEAEHEITLNEEEAVVDKQTVAKERVKLGKETVVENQQVSGEVRKEQVEVEGDETGRSH